MGLCHNAPCTNIRAVHDTHPCASTLHQHRAQTPPVEHRHPPHPSFQIGSCPPPPPPPGFRAPLRVLAHSWPLVHGSLPKGSVHRTHNINRMPVQNKPTFKPEAVDPCPGHVVKFPEAHGPNWPIATSLVPHGSRRSRDKPQLMRDLLQN